MNKTLYIIFMILLLAAFATGMYLSLEAGETLGKSLVRSVPIFLVMFIFYKLRKMDIESEQKKVTESNIEADNNE
ncbi:MAG: hypothetical protein OEY78_08480 [Gammaproteobacteria bacterium]|nr:hypothetical protein [Gammaproteobacteria bacterium]